MREKWNLITRTVKQRLVRNTLNFAFILVFINLFQAVFGPENNILAVSLAILMPASTVRDMTAAPVKHLCVQALVLELMVCSAFLVRALPPLAALPVNLCTLLILLYAYTYENASHMYFPYILSYLFLLFIGPVTAEQLPRRMLGALTGAVCTILYQFYSNRTRAAETSHDRLTALVEQAGYAARAKLDGGGGPPDLGLVRRSVRTLSRLVYERRRKALCLSEAGCALVDAGRTLEYLCLLLAGLPGDPAPGQRAFLEGLVPWLDGCRDYVLRRRDAVPPPDFLAAAPVGEGLAELERTAEALARALTRMADREGRRRCRPTGLSLWVRVRAAMDVSAVRTAYAVRVAVLLALGTLAVQVLGLAHGKWVLFTIASLSLPYADDVGVKTKKRILGTLAGGAAAVVVFSLFPGRTARVFLMMLSGYLGGFFTDYAQTYACSTVGALGGAVFPGVFGWGAVGGMFALRASYILLGAVIALVFNRLVLPFTREAATSRLTAKYVRLSDQIVRFCPHADADPQLYYSLVIQANLTEEKLLQNAGADGRREEVLPLVARCRERVLAAHRAAAPVPSVPPAGFSS